MTGIEIMGIVVGAVVLEWSTRRETRRFFRARRRLRAMKKSKKNPVLEEQRLLQLEHWKQAAAQSRGSMDYYRKHNLLASLKAAELDHERAQRKIKELSEP